MGGPVPKFTLMPLLVGGGVRGPVRGGGMAGRYCGRRDNAVHACAPSPRSREPSPTHSPKERPDAHRHPRGLRRDDRPRQGGRLRVPGDQRHLVADAQRRPAGLRRGGQRRHRPGLHRRRRVPVRPDRQGHGHRFGRARRATPHEVAKNYPVNVALHTDHCPKDKLDGFVRPLLPSPRSGSPRAASRCSSRTCGTARRCRWTRTWRSPRSCSPTAPRPRSILEIEVGVVGGEEDGVVGAIDEKLYTTVEDGWPPSAALGLGEKGRYMAALTFGNVHGVYKPGNVKLRPEILKEIQDAVGAKYGAEKPFNLVFHGGSGSLLSEIRVGAGLRRGQDEHRHRHPVRVHPPGRGAHVHATTTACSRSTARSATRRPTTRAPGASRPRTGMAKRVVEACEDLRSHRHHQHQVTRPLCKKGHLRSLRREKVPFLHSRGG